AAQEAARADDFGESDFESGLAVALESAERDAQLTLLGRMGIRDMLVNALTQRLLRVQFRREHPEVFEAPLTPPIIVMGLPRSGTTLLHRLLSLAPEARSLRYFELRRPLDEPGNDRLAWARSQQRSFKWLARGLDAKHASGPEEPEECLFLFDSTLVSATFWIAAPLYGYLDWYLAQDQRAPYRAYREYLQIFQRETPERRLTLKAPIHTPHVRALFAAVPEARLVQLHRDPRPALASANSLFATLHRVVTDSLDCERLGRANFELVATGMDRLLDARTTLPEGAIHDVYYDELVRDPLGVVRDIRNRFELGFDAAYEERLREYLRENPQHKHGPHRYRADDFGLSDDEIQARFARYLETFPRTLRAHVR
ncbi:MAG TPA: sulfotransferase, partial [Polyangiaceae bacterium]|nr:sulfotransferase [Polyangiaceae bacterium]